MTYKELNGIKMTQIAKKWHIKQENLQIKKWLPNEPTLQKALKFPWDILTDIDPNKVYLKRPRKFCKVEHH